MQPCFVGTSSAHCRLWHCSPSAEYFSTIRTHGSRPSFPDLKRHTRTSFSTVTPFFSIAYVIFFPYPSHLGISAYTKPGNHKITWSAWCYLTWSNQGLTNRFSAFKHKHFEIVRFQDLLSNTYSPNSKSNISSYFIGILTARSTLLAAAMSTEPIAFVNAGRGAYDTTGVPKPQPPKPR